MDDTAVNTTRALSPELIKVGEKLTQDIKSAVAHPIPRQKYMALNDEPNDNLVEDHDHMQATVRIPFKDLRHMDIDEIVYLKEVLYIAIRNGDAKVLSPQLISLTERDHPANALMHELEHAAEVPEGIKDAVLIDLTFIQDQLISIDGTTWYPLEKVTPRDQALISSAPISLSESDVISALEYASQTNDAGFVEEIEGRISTKLRHELTAA